MREACGVSGRRLSNKGEDISDTFTSADSFITDTVIALRAIDYDYSRGSNFFLYASLWKRHRQEKEREGVARLHRR